VERHWRRGNRPGGIPYVFYWDVDETEYSSYIVETIASGSGDEATLRSKGVNEIGFSETDVNRMIASARSHGTVLFVYYTVGGYWAAVKLRCSQ